MFRVEKICGLGNILIYLSQIDDKTPVSTNIHDGYRGKYLKFKNLNIQKDDGKLESLKPDIYINHHTIKYIHPLCRHKIEPSLITKNLLENEYKGMLENVDYGLAIRFGNMNEHETLKFVNDLALERFETVIHTCKGKVFVACDRLDYKLSLKARFGDKVKCILSDFVSTWSVNDIDSHTPYVEFFILSMCPKLYITGGPKNFSAFSTFGYMAAIYGNKEFEVIWNS